MGCGFAEGKQEQVLILFECAHRYRIIPIVERPHAGNDRVVDGRLTRLLGWNTLDVDVTNHNAKTWFDQAGNFHSPGAHMVERFTLIDPN